MSLRKIPNLKSLTRAKLIDMIHEQFHELAEIERNFKRLEETERKVRKHMNYIDEKWREDNAHSRKVFAEERAEKNKCKTLLAKEILYKQE